MRYQLVAIDIDGTLLTDDNTITARNRHAILEAVSAGTQIVLCSGRAPESLLPLLQELGIEGYFICHNGSVIVHSGTNEILYEVGFRPSTVEGIVRYCRVEGIHTDFCTALEMYTESLERADVREMYFKYLARPTLVPDVLSFGQTLVKFTLFGTEVQLDKAFEQLLQMNPPVQTLRSGPTYIDLIDRSVSKGVALAHLAKHLNISIAETIAIGNYFNDVAMIKTAGVGVAVGNSPDAVKQQADLVVASNNDSGVAVALERLVLRSGQLL